MDGTSWERRHGVDLGESVHQDVLAEHQKHRYSGSGEKKTVQRYESSITSSVQNPFCDYQKRLNCKQAFFAAEKGQSRKTTISLQLQANYANYKH